MKKKYAKDPSLLWKMIAKQKPLPQHDFEVLSVALRMNFQRLLNGDYDGTDHRGLCAAMNTCALRSVDIGKECSVIANDAIHALATIAKRHDTWGKWECIKSEEIALGYGLELHDQLLLNSDLGSLAVAFKLQDELAA